MNFDIKNRHISVVKCEIIGDNADYTANFTFDTEWNGRTKTARFINCGNYVDVILQNDSCTIPCEVLKSGFVHVGVYSATITTTYAEFIVAESIKEKNGNAPDPTPSVYAQILEEMDGKQAKLTAGRNITIDENNEISATGGGGDAPVQSVCGKEGVVELDASDVGAATEEYVNNAVSAAIAEVYDALSDMDEVIGE